MSDKTLVHVLFVGQNFGYGFVQHFLYDIRYFKINVNKSFLKGNVEQ